MVGERKPILCLDFDGVLHRYDTAWQGAAIIPDGPVDFAIEFLCEALTHFDVHVHSSRSHQEGGIEAMKRWLDKHEDAWLGTLAAGKHVMPWYAQAGVKLSELIQWPVEKPPAHVSIDDRALTFNGTWPTVQSLAAFKPWNKR